MYAPRSGGAGIADDSACDEIIRPLIAENIPTLIAMTTPIGVTPSRVYQRMIATAAADATAKIRYLPTASLMRPMSGPVNIEAIPVAM